VCAAGHFEVAALWYYPGVLFWFIGQAIVLHAQMTNAHGDPKVSR
jgi:hypothetical protein